MPELTRQGDVFVLDIGDTPDDDNRLTVERMAALHDALDEVLASSGPAALVTTARGRFYSNGLVPELFGEPGYLTAYIGILCKLLRADMATIAALPGHTYAGGLILACAHDERFMREDRGFLCFPEAAIGIPFTPGMSALVAGKLPGPTAQRAMVTAERYTGATALAAGLVDALAPAEQVLERAIARAAELAPLRGPTIATIRTTLNGTAVALLATESGATV